MQDGYHILSFVHMIPIPQRKHGLIIVEIGSVLPRNPSHTMLNILGIASVFKSAVSHSAPHQPYSVWIVL